MVRQNPCLWLCGSKQRCSLLQITTKAELRRFLSSWLSLLTLCPLWLVSLLSSPSQPNLTLLFASVSSDVSLFAGICVDTELCKFFSWFVFNKTGFHQRKSLIASNTVHKHPSGHLGCFRYRTNVFLSYLLHQTFVVYFWLWQSSTCSYFLYP